MISIIILIACTAAVSGAPTRFIVIFEKTSILNNLTSEAQSEYYDILHELEVRQHSTLAEIDEKHVKWAEKHGISKEWTAYNEKHLAREKKFNETALSVIENLPVVHRIFSEILSNQNQTNREFDNALDKLDERFPLESKLVAYLTNLMIQNEEALMNERSICSVEMRNSATIYLTVRDELKLLLNNLTSEAREDFNQIWLDENSTFAEKNKKCDKWAEKYGISGKWTTYNENLLARKKKIFKTVLSVIENLPSVYRMYSEVTNRNQTITAMTSAVDELDKTNCLEFNLILGIKQIVIQNDEEEEKRKKNGGNIATGNKVFRKMKDSPINGNFKSLLLPGPL